MSILDTVKSKWEKMKPIVIALALGLIVGPFISNMIGWQVTSGTSEQQVLAAVVEQQALFCVERVRATGINTGGLDYRMRGDLADKWAVMPGQDSADYKVKNACSEKLGEQ